MPMVRKITPSALEEELLSTFFTKNRGTADIVVLDFPTPDQVDKESQTLAPPLPTQLRRLRDITHVKLLSPKGILIERLDLLQYKAALKDLASAGVHAHSLLHVTYQQHSRKSTKDLGEDSSLYSTTNTVAHLLVSSKSPSSLNWSAGSKWRRSWASTNVLGPHVVPESDILTYTAPQESKKAPKKAPFFTVPPLPTAFWMEVLTLVSNSDSNIAVPSVGTGNLVAACALLGRKCTSWVFDDLLNSSLDSYLMDLETKSTEDAGKVFEKLILERDFLCYVKSTLCMTTTPQRTPKSKLSEIHVVDVDDEVSIEVPKAFTKVGSVPRKSRGVPSDVAKYLDLQAKVASTQDSDSDSSLSKRPDVTFSEDESEDKDDDDGDGGEEGKEEEKEPEPPKPEPRTLRHGRQVPTEDESSPKHRRRAH
ncbi:hypothetical protein HDU93_008312 [Gonapodya sp. JEL0774]|nr:hypothetical protein HDU93_008312 [Gonapodya sp. JEL0774]